jgi:hypothetical protein
MGVTLFDDASLVLIPSGIKASKVYSVKPEDGTGDFTFSRASTATRTNSAGLIESVASNVPRLDYMTATGALATCPMLEAEQQRTNLVFPSATATTQTRTVTATAHTLTFYGTGSVTLSGVATGTLTGTGANNRVALTFTPTAGSLTLTVSGTVTNWQLEAGAFSSTLIPTTTATVTRLKDDIAISGASALIGQTEGTFFLDVDFRVVTAAGIRAFFGIEGSVGNQFSGFAVTTQNNGNDVFYAGTAYTLTQGRHKIVCTYNQTANQSKLFVDGALRSTGTFSGFLATIDRISVLGRINPFGSFSVDRQQFGGCNQFVIFKTALSDAQCIELSTI